MNSFNAPRGRYEDHDPQRLVDPDLPTVDLPSERRSGRVAGLCALGSVACTFGAVLAASRDVAQTVDSDSSDLERLRTLGQSGAGQEVGTLLRVLSGLLVVVVALFLYRAIKGRKPDHPFAVVLTGCISVIILALAVAYQFYDLRDVARDFVALPSGQQNNAQASRVFDDANDDVLLRAANVLQVLASIGFGIWISVTSFEASNVGLLTRFLGLFGTGAGLTTAIPVFGVIGTALFLAWLGSVGVLALGYWTGGRPPAWETGQATLPWEQQGDPPGASRHTTSQGGA